MSGGFEKITKDGLVYYRAENISKLGFLEHMFTTRIGGVSTDEHVKSLNLGINKEENSDNVITNFTRVCASLGAKADEVVVLKQIHTDIVHEYKKGDVSRIYSTDGRINADGVVSDVSGSSFGVFYADCVPIILADGKRKVAAAVHSGWRSTAMHIVKEAALKMVEEYGCEPSDIAVAIGPHIRECCFETDIDAAEKFLKKYREKKGEKYFINLSRVIYDDLRELGVKNICDCGLCTCCDKGGEFFSSRAQKGKMGLMGAFVRLK